MENNTPTNQDLTPIPLADGQDTNALKLQHYFNQILQAEQSGEEYPIDLDDIARIYFSRKDAAVRVLHSLFMKDIDYQSFHHLVEREIGASTKIKYRLTTRCAEFLIIRNNLVVFDVYRRCRQALQQQLTKLPALPNFADPVIAARVWADAEEGRRQLQQQLQREVQQHAAACAENRRLLQVAVESEEELQQTARVLEKQQEAVDLVDFLTQAEATLTLEQAAKTLDVPQLGRTKLIKLLLAKKVLLKSSRLPAQLYLNQGYFKVKQVAWKDETGKMRLHDQVLVTTGKGMAFLRKLVMSN